MWEYRAWWAYVLTASMIFVLTLLNADSLIWIVLMALLGVGLYLMEAVYSDKYAKMIPSSGLPGHWETRNSSLEEKSPHGLKYPVGVISPDPADMKQTQEARKKAYSTKDPQGGNQPLQEYMAYCVTPFLVKHYNEEARVWQVWETTAYGFVEYCRRDNRFKQLIDLRTAVAERDQNKDYRKFAPHFMAQMGEHWWYGTTEPDDDEIVKSLTPMELKSGWYKDLLDSPYMEPLKVNQESLKKFQGWLKGLPQLRKANFSAKGEKRTKAHNFGYGNGNKGQQQPQQHQQPREDLQDHQLFDLRSQEDVNHNFEQY